MLLSVRNLQKTYGVPPNQLEAIRTVSFDVEQGSFVTIVGPSGAGKTTLLRCLGALLPRSAGSISLAGREVDNPPEEMACVFQDFSRSLMPWFTVARNVSLPLVNKLEDKGERHWRTVEALEEVGLGGFAESYPWQLSGGMQQRVAIARAIAYRPDILLMDEPFASVDAQTRAELEDLILRVRHEVGVTILLVTHDIDEAVYLSDHVVVLSRRPTEIVELIEVSLPRPRDQLETKSLPGFVDLRAHILRLIRQESTNGGEPPGGKTRQDNATKTAL